MIVDHACTSLAGTYWAIVMPGIDKFQSGRRVEAPRPKGTPTR